MMVVVVVIQLLLASDDDDDDGGVIATLLLLTLGVVRMEVVGSGPEGGEGKLESVSILGLFRRR